jgi:glycosyltransferase involved in cell wall biosynthesis
MQYRIPLARNLRDAGFEVHVALPGLSALQDAREPGITFHAFHLQRTSTRPWDELRCLISLIRLYKQLRPTLVHHFGMKPTLYGGVSARLARIPAVMSALTGLGHAFTARSMKMRALGPVIACGLRFAFRHQEHRVIVQTQEDCDTLVARRIVAREHAVVIKGSGVDLSVFRYEPEPAGPLVVMMASRLLWEKGVGEFAAAARSLRARGINARFLLVGEPDVGHPSAVPKRTLERWHEAGDIEWLGWRDEMPALISQSHIVCLPSRYGEGIPRILLEAAASGRPIVATSIPGVREIVYQGQNGVLVPPADSEALARAIESLVENAPLRAAMGIRGREIVSRGFTREQVVAANLFVYRSVLASVPASCVPSRGSF